ncbi:MAG: thioredoxin domain-containing protein [Bryobacteraceae bacterium]|jgi:protein-disulfide isomerase
MKVIALALAAFLPCLAAAPPVDKGKALGSPSAPVTIEIFSDFECPACRAFHQDTLPLLMKDYVVRGKLYIVSREFPLNIPDHKYSREAAAYATAAARVGRYYEVADALFQVQGAWAVSGMVWETVAPALTPEQQKRAQALAKDPEVLKEVQADVDYGTAIGINRTPTIYVSHGSQHYPLSEYALTYSLLKSMIDDLSK